MDHLVIPDTQAKPGVSSDHMVWAAKYALEHRPPVIVHLGDHWDMPSLSSYDTIHGKVAAGVDILGDIEAGNESLARFDNTIAAWNRNTTHKRRYFPRKIMLRGNHENRLARAVAADPMVEGFVKAHPLESPGWEVVPFLEVIEVDGIAYCHFFPRARNGCVVQDRRGAPSAMAQCVREGRSATAGHKQGLDVARVCVGGGRTFRGVIAGAFYLHDESYKGPQGNTHWRGLLHKHNVQNGDYDLSEVSMATLRARYAD